MVRTVRAGRRRRRSPELAGRPPAGGGTAVARPPTVADGRIPRPCPSPAYVFFPQTWSEPSERAVDEEDRRSSPDGRRPAVARRWHGRQPGGAGGFPARVPRRPTFFPPKMVPTLRAGRRRRRLPELARRPPA